jgi:2-isopropylmalate synthase
MNGLGERAGNAALEEVVMGLHTRKDFYQCETNIVTQEIHRTSRLVASLANMDPSPGKAIIGANVFVHESGIHQHGVLNNPLTYEIMKAEDLGMVGAGVVLGKLSGKHAFEDKALSLGYKLSEQELEAAFYKFKQMADRKKVVTDRDIEALMGGQISEVPEIYHIRGFQVSSTNHMKATAAITLMRDGVEYTEAAVGVGPIEAAFRAVDKITKMNLQLMKYRLKAASEGRDALGEVVLNVRHGDKTATGRGISVDVVEASILAYVAGLNRIISEI